MSIRPTLGWKRVREIVQKPAGLEKARFRVTGFRPGQAIFALMLLVVAASVAPSQSPQDHPPLSGGQFPMGVQPSGIGLSGAGAAGEMIGFSHTDGAGTQTITLVDTRKSWMAVYHVERSGTIRLVSSRPIDADFSLQLNATAPLPEEIRRIGKR